MTDDYLPLRGDRGHDVAHYDLTLEVRPGSNTLVGRAHLTVTVHGAGPGITLDLAEPLRVGKVLVDGTPTRHRHRAGRLTLGVPAGPPGRTVTVDVRWSGSPAPRRGPWGEVGWEELTDGVLVAGQPDGASTWFPCNDRLDAKATYRTTVTAPSAYTVVTHGVLAAQHTSGSRTTWVHEQGEPTAPYLATVQVGRYVAHAHGRTRLVAPPEVLAAARRDTARQDEMLATFEDLFGPYPFTAPYTVVVTDDDLEIPVEAQGLSVFGANHLDGSGSHERLVAHELAHQWFGNSLTAGCWRDIWLHEGFACYAEWLWSERSGGAPAAHHAAAAHRLLSGLPQDLVVTDPGPARMFDDRVYQRGALTLHALRTDLGDEPFFALLRAWVASHRHGVVTTAQLRALADRDALLTAWLDAPALPPLPATPAG